MSTTSLPPHPGNPGSALPGSAPRDVARLGHPPPWLLPALSVAAVLVGWWTSYPFGWLAMIVTIVAPAALILCTARAPALGLLGVGLLWAVHLLGGVTPSYPLIAALAAVVFGCAAFGRRRTAITTAILLLLSPLPVLAWEVVRWSDPTTVAQAIQNLRLGMLPATLGRLANSDTLSALAFPMIVLGFPWLLGLAWRSVIRSWREAAHAAQEIEAANRETAYAQEVAHLRAGQTQLARDVHDVVGHSLAVILAQAQSAQYLADDEVETMRETLATVADSARRSLGDVRSVLSGSPRAATAESATMESLISGVRSAGNTVIERVDGSPRPLPPDLAQVCYRVVQEMLTNALKHGRTGGPVWVRQVWPSGSEGLLALEVHNFVEPGQGSPAGGIGLESMRARLASVGGSLRIESEQRADGTLFAALALLPLRAAEVRAAEARTEMGTGLGTGMGTDQARAAETGGAGIPAAGRLAAAAAPEPEGSGDRPVGSTPGRLRR